MRPASVASSESACRLRPGGDRAPERSAGDRASGRSVGARAFLRAAIAVVVVIAADVLPRAASAEEGDACVSAYEGAQEAKRAGQVVRARSELRLCQRSCPAALAKDCASWLPEIEARVASLKLDVRGPGGREVLRARVLVDRQPLPEGAALSTPWELDPGAHSVLIESPGALPARQSILLQNGERSVLRITLAPAPVEPPPRPESGARRATPTAAYVVGGAGVLALGAGAFLGIKGHLDAAALRDRCAPFCEQSEVDSISTQWVVGGALAGAGALALGTAFWLAWSGSSDTPTKGALSPRGLSLTARGALVRFLGAR